MPPVLCFVALTYTDGPGDTYQIPLAFSTDAEADDLIANQPQSILAKLAMPGGAAVLHDATTREDFRQSLLSLIEDDATLALSQSNGSDVAAAAAAAVLAQGIAAAETAQLTHEMSVAPLPISAQPGEAATPARTDSETTHPASAQHVQPRESPYAGDNGNRGCLEARASTALAAARTAQALPSRAGSAEQSNTSILYGDKLILKLFRRLQPGENPDVEIGRYLTEAAHFPRIAPFLGEIALTSASGEKTTVAMLQGMVANQGDGWQWFLEQLSEFFAQVAELPAPPKAHAPSFLEEWEPLREALVLVGPSLQAAALLGRRTAEMHLALAASTANAAFSAEPMTAEDLARDAQRIDAQITSTLEALRVKLSTLKDLAADDAALLLSRRIDLFARANAIAIQPTAGQRIRIHGDYHLGQTLRTPDVSRESSKGLSTETGDFVLLDFEGEPARPLAERRQKQSPLKDVAGMIRSFSYAAHSGLNAWVAARADRSHGLAGEAMSAWAVFWQDSIASAFLRAYRESVATNPILLPPPPQAQGLLAAYLLEKALYELLYELNNRPAWLRIPLAGILAL